MSVLVYVSKVAISVKLIHDVFLNEECLRGACSSVYVPWKYISC